VRRFDGSFSFDQASIRPFAQDLVDTLLLKIASAGSAEKIAENDHLMKCLHTLSPCTK
jgi:exportin-2 (importin alpha re-exporter)